MHSEREGRHGTFKHVIVKDQWQNKASLYLWSPDCNLDEIAVGKVFQISTLKTAPYLTLERRVDTTPHTILTHMPTQEDAFAGIVFEDGSITGKIEKFSHIHHIRICRNCHCRIRTEESKCKKCGQSVDNVQYKFIFQMDLRHDDKTYICCGRRNILPDGDSSDFDCDTAQEILAILNSKYLNLKVSLNYTEEKLQHAVFGKTFFRIHNMTLI